MNKIIGFLIIIIIALGGYMYQKEQRNHSVIAQNNINTGSGVISGSGDPIDDTSETIYTQDSSEKTIITESGVFSENPETQATSTYTEEVVIATEDNTEDIDLLVDDIDTEKKDLEIETQEGEEEEVVIPDPEPEPVSGYEKALYMWSAPFGDHSAGDIVDFIDDQSIETAIISMNQAHTSRITKIAVINSLSADGKNIEVMLSKNSVIDDTDEEILAYVESVFSGSFNFSPIDRIHLDIEPHVMNDWHNNKTAYLDKYMNMLEIIKSYADSKGVGISVSIPLHYPIEYTNQILDTVDMVYFMAYENISASHITRKTGEYLPSHQSKINIALRTNDFDTSAELHNLADTLLSDMDLDDYTIHDFQSLKEFIDEE